MTIEQQIAQLEHQKKELERAKEREEILAIESAAKQAEGKYFKSCKTHRWNNKFIGVSNISFIYINRHLKENTFDVEGFDISFSPAGWVLKNNRLSIQTGNNKVSVQVKKYYGSNTIQAGCTKHSEYFFNSGKYDGILTSASGYDVYRECSKEEYFDALNFCIDNANKFSVQAAKFFQDSYYKPLTAEQEGIINFDYTMVKKYEDLLELSKNIPLETLMIHAGKIRKYNYFVGTRLEELCQYSEHGEQGLLLEIVGGDDGTDYEPYTTHYFIEAVILDWLTILYPIRTLIDSVHDTAKELCNYKPVYNPSNWICDFDTSTYDATFKYAKLKDNVLMDINKIIEKHVR